MPRLRKHQVKIMFADRYKKNWMEHKWKIIDFLQKDAKSKGVLKGKHGFPSFWHNISHIVNEDGYQIIMLDSSNRLVGFAVIDRCLHHPDDYWNGKNLCIQFFQIIPQFQGKGYGKVLVNWIKAKATEKELGAINARPIPSSEGFWRKLGFDNQDSLGYLVLPLIHVSRKP